MVNNSPRAIGLTAFGVAAGFTLLILACVLDSSYWPMMVLLPYVIMPFPLIFCGSVSNSGAATINTDGILKCPWQHIGQFVVGTLVTSTFAVHAVFMHLDMIEERALAFALCSNILIFGSIIGYFIWSSKQSEY